MTPNLQSYLKIIRKFYLVYQDRGKDQKSSSLSASITPESSKAWIFMETFEVSALVNAPKNDRPECLVAV